VHDPVGPRKSAELQVADKMALAIPNADPRIAVMTIMWTLWSVVLAAIGAKIFTTLSGATRVVKKLGPPVTAARLMVWKHEWAAISADAETAQFQARASAGQDVWLLGR